MYLRKELGEFVFQRVEGIFGVGLIFGFLLGFFETQCYNTTILFRKAKS